MKLFAPVLAAAMAVLPAPSEAAVVYNLFLTPDAFSTIGGTGSITLNAAPSATGLTTYTAGSFSNLSFTIGGQTFSAPPGIVGAVQFLNGSVSNITFSQQIGDSPNRYSLQTTSVYAFGYNNLLSLSTGTLSSAPAPAAVPEPAGWAMMIGGFALVGAGLRRRRTTVRFA